MLAAPACLRLCCSFDYSATLAGARIRCFLFRRRLLLALNLWPPLAGLFSYIAEKEESERERES